MGQIHFLGIVGHIKSLSNNFLCVFLHLFTNVKAIISCLVIYKQYEPDLTYWLEFADFWPTSIILLNITKLLNFSAPNIASSSFVWDSSENNFS